MSAAAGSKQWDYLEQIDNSFISQNYSLFKARGIEFPSWKTPVFYSSSSVIFQFLPLVLERQVYRKNCGQDLKIT